MSSPKRPEAPAQFDLFAAPRAASAPAVPRAAMGSAPPPPREPEPSEDEAPPFELLLREPEAASAAMQQTRAAPPQERPAAPRIYQVTDLVRLASRALEARFSDLWVEGELSNVKAPGHVYFTLKDATAQLPAVMFLAAARRLKFRLHDGLKVRVRGRLAVYEVQGKLQLYADAIEPAGLGALQLAFEQLKKQLAEEGLFERARKRPLPFLPRRIGVVTSPHGAAVRDIIRVATRRAPVAILISPCAVQGEGAAAEIVRALALLERQPGVDVIIIGRGGGSLEDLAAFNDEAVARAIDRCPVPVVSAVGHEVDFTIADFVADRRAATPSQAAELVVPVQAELAREAAILAQRLARAAARRLSDLRQHLDGERAQLATLAQRSIEARRRGLRGTHERLAAQHPAARLARDRRRLDELTRRLDRPLPELLLRRRRQLDDLARRLQRPLPERLAAAARALLELAARRDAAMQQLLLGRRRLLEARAGTLQALSPLKVLERGYALVRDAADHVVTAATQVAPGDRLSVRLARGVVAARVEQVDDEA